MATLSLSHRNTPVVPERHSFWNTVQPDLDLNEYNPMDELPSCITSFFEALVQTPRGLMDRFKLPASGRAAVAQANSAGIASPVSDGSYDDSRRAGSSAFIIAPNKDKGAECLEGANFVTNLPEEHPPDPHSAQCFNNVDMWMK